MLPVAHALFCTTLCAIPGVAGPPGWVAEASLGPSRDLPLQLLQKTEKPPQPEHHCTMWSPMRTLIPLSLLQLWRPCATGHLLGVPLVRRLSPQGFFA